MPPSSSAWPPVRLATALAISAKPIEPAYP